MVRGILRRASFIGTGLRGVAGLGIVVCASAVGAAACGSIDTDLFVGDTAGAGGGTTATTGTGGQSPTSSSSSASSSSSSASSTSSSSTSSSGTPAACGNGKIEPGEACDGADLGGKDCTAAGFSSPGGASCTDQCTLDYSGCAATCDGAKLEQGETCDGAFLGGHTCLEFGYATADGLTCTGCQLDPSTCQATCGNGQIEPGETCDGAALAGKSCTDYGFAGAAGLKCLGDCSGYDPSGCMTTCGNGVLEPGETCDGANLNGHTCAELGYANPAGLKCTACSLDSTGCKAVCGNGKVEPGETCDDGNTQSGDGCSNLCKLESNPGTTCGTAIPVTVGLGSTTITGSTAGGGSHAGSTCTGSGASDRVYQITVQNSGFLTVSLSRAGTSYDSVLYVAQGCADGQATTSILCADSYDTQTNSGLNGGEVVSLRVQQGQKYYVFVDGYGTGDTGNYQMVVDLSTGTDCNDPVPIPLEPGAPMTLLGSNTNIPATTQGTCGGQPGGQVVYRITRPDTAATTVATQMGTTNYNSVLYARSICTMQQPELACSNQNGTAMESITVPAQTASTPVYVFVDGSQAGGGNASGNYGLVLTP